MKKSFLIFHLLVSVFSAKAQGIDSMVKVYAAQVPDQKVYVHFDKDLYRAGETIWFKAYLFSGFSLSVNSKNFYAELLNGQGKVLQRKVYPVTASSAAGSFDLPDPVPGGQLVFRAYTTWMLNFDAAFIFQKNISVISSATQDEKTAQTKNYSVQFLPEGGNLVSGLRTVVAFKATDQAGMPVAAKGTITDSKGSLITDFTSLHDGMGTFNLTPIANEKYQGVWTDPSGRQQTIPLPAVQAQGITLALTQAGNKKIFHLTRTDDVPESWKKLHIIALLGQQPVFRTTADLTGVTGTSGAIPVGTLPSGIMQVTIFSDAWEPVAERITMINNENYLFDARLNTAEFRTGPREKNSVEIEVDDTLLCNLSLSVTDAAAGGQTAADNLVSAMLLTGDIRGYVHNPAAYFADRADSTAKKLDLVMLTHGWRKYNWTDLAAGRKPVLAYPSEDYLSIGAKVPGAASPLPGDEQLRIFIQGKDSSYQLLMMPGTGADQFSLPDIVFYDTATVYYEFAKKPAKNMQVVFYNNFYRGEEKVTLPPRPAGTAAGKLTTGNPFQPPVSGSGMLAPVTVKSHPKSRLEQMDERYTSGLFRNAQGYAFDITGESASYPDIFFYLQGKVPGGLRIIRSAEGTRVLWRGSMPALFLDEIASDVIRLSSIPVSNIAYVKVVRPPFMGVYMGGANGAIAVYTKRGGDEKQEPAKGLNKGTVAGYSSVKEFYSPSYKDLSVAEQAAAGYRTTLYWNPFIITDATRKKVKLEFYNNDITTAFRIVLEGVNENGKMVRIEKIIR